MFYTLSSGNLPYPENRGLNSVGKKKHLCEQALDWAPIYPPISGNYFLAAMGPNPQQR